MMIIEIKKVEQSSEFEMAKDLFKQYALSLPFKLDFQNFDDELNVIDKQYGQPEGGLFLAFVNDKPIGCIGLRKIQNFIGEVKRMYVMPDYRGNKVGAKLLQATIDFSRILDYKLLKLDTLDDMFEAIQLYKSFGFKETSSYTYNPFANALFFELDLNN
jgi:putative acetyltransferase